MASAALIGAGPSAAAQRSPCLKGESLRLLEPVQGPCKPIEAELAVSPAVVRCSRPACRRSTVSVR